MSALTLSAFTVGFPPPWFTLRTSTISNCAFAYLLSSSLLADSNPDKWDARLLTSSSVPTISNTEAAKVLISFGILEANLASGWPSESPNLTAKPNWFNCCAFASIANEFTKPRAKPKRIFVW